MGTINKSEKIIQLTFELPEDFSRPEKVVTDTDGITVINDTSQPALVLVGNNFLGPASVGYVWPDQSLVLPCGWALWDVYVLFEQPGSAELFIKWEIPVALHIYYNKSKNNVGYRDTVKISQM